MSLRRTVPVILVIALPALAAAEPPEGYHQTELVVVPPPKDADKGGMSQISDIIYINGCWDGGCQIRKDGNTNDAIANYSSIPNGNTTITPFAHGVEVWDQTIACLREVYGPYNVQIVDSRVDPDPAEDQLFHHEAILAGVPGEIGQGDNIFGIALISCDPNSGPVPVNNAISFSFANQIGPSVIDLCWTVAQEAAHSFGLDHVVECLDPMTYMPGCGQKYFRNGVFKCGEFAERPCMCNSGLQNSHQMLTNVFGKGTLPPPPAVTIEGPQEGAMVNDSFGIYAKALDPRLVSRVELYVNGLKYDERPGFGYSQRDGTYQFDSPQGLPGMSVLDIEIRAYNDLDVMGSGTVTVTRGGPCASADVCLEGQICEEGRCRYRLDGQLGEACERSQDCESLLCPDNGGELLCSQYCNPTLGADACPTDYECLAAGGSGVCWPAVTDTGGCCSVSGDDDGPSPVQIGLFLLVAVVLVRRPRRR